MHCFHCGQEIRGSGVLLNMDGDFACDEKCKEGYEKEKAHFFQ